jgi:hypothetical protein
VHVEADVVAYMVRKQIHKRLDTSLISIINAHEAELGLEHESTHITAQIEPQRLQIVLQHALRSRMDLIERGIRVLATQGDGMPLHVQDCEVEIFLGG